MSVERVRVTLNDDEYKALIKLSERELRSVPEQVRAVVRERLRRAGLLNEQQEAARCNS